MENKLSEEAYQRKIDRNNEYNKSYTTSVNMRLNHNTDYDIIAYLRTITNKQGLMKELLRQRMKDEGFTVQEEA